MMVNAGKYTSPMDPILRYPNQRNPAEFLELHMGIEVVLVGDRHSDTLGYTKFASQAEDRSQKSTKVIPSYLLTVF